MDNQRNLLLAVVLSGLLLLGWDAGMRYFYPQPVEPVAAADTNSTTATTAQNAGAPGPVGASGTENRGGNLGELAPAAQGPVDLAAALASGNRIKIDAPRVAGSINLVGARIDDIVLKNYDQTIDDGSEPVRLFAPDRTDAEHFAEFGFVVGGQRMSSRAIWQADGDRLTPDTPVTLSHTDENGLTFRVKLSIDDNYMISAEQSVENASENAAIVQPFALI